MQLDHRPRRLTSTASAFAGKGGYFVLFLLGAFLGQLVFDRIGDWWLLESLRQPGYDCVLPIRNLAGTSLVREMASDLNGDGMTDTYWVQAEGPGETSVTFTISDTARAFPDASNRSPVDVHVTNAGYKAAYFETVQDGGGTLEHAISLRLQSESDIDCGYQYYDLDADGSFDLVVQGTPAPSAAWIVDGDLWREVDPSDDGTVVTRDSGDRMFYQGGKWQNAV